MAKGVKIWLNKMCLSKKINRLNNKKKASCGLELSLINLFEFYILNILWFTIIFEKNIVSSPKTDNQLSDSDDIFFESFCLCIKVSIFELTWLAICLFLSLIPFIYRCFLASDYLFFHTESSICPSVTTPECFIVVINVSTFLAEAKAEGYSAIVCSVFLFWGNTAFGLFDKIPLISTRRTSPMRSRKRMIRKPIEIYPHIHSGVPIRKLKTKRQIERW